MKERKWTPEARRFARTLLRDAPKKSELPALEQRRAVLTRQVIDLAASPEMRGSSSLLLDVADSLNKFIGGDSVKLGWQRNQVDLTDHWHVSALLRVTETWHKQLEGCAVTLEQMARDDDKRWRIFRDPEANARLRSGVREIRNVLGRRPAIEVARAQMERLQELQGQLATVCGRLNLVTLKDELERDKIRGHEKAYAKASARDQTARRRADALKTAVERTPNCPYCGNPIGEDPHLDHIVPVSSGGLAVPENLAYCCVACNLSKQDRGLLEFLFDRGLDVRVVYDRLREMGKRI